MTTSCRRRGFSLVEIMFVVVISAIILGAAWAVVSAVVSGDDALRNRVTLQLEASNALKEMASVLKQSGVTTDINTGNTYPVVFPLLYAPPPPPAPTSSGSAPYAWSNIPIPSQLQHTTVPVPNIKAEEGLGGSQGILFRIAKDSMEVDALGNPVTGLQHAPLDPADTAFNIQWGNEFHALTVVYNQNTGANDLQHQIFYYNPVTLTTTLKSKTTLARYVSRLIFEMQALPAPAPTPIWPLPTGATGTTGTWPAPPNNPFEIRITICLAKPDINNPNNALTSSKRMTAVWQQTNVIMRSVQR
jgi:prepilin-type N-terminal cleavage/methylation domain-containing protein